MPYQMPYWTSYGYAVVYALISFTCKLNIFLFPVSFSNHNNGDLLLFFSAWTEWFIMFLF